MENWSEFKKYIKLSGLSIDQISDMIMDKMLHKLGIARRKAELETAKKTGFRVLIAQKEFSDLENRIREMEKFSYSTTQKGLVKNGKN